MNFSRQHIFNNLNSINEQEIIDCVFKLKNDSSPGIDNITVNTLKKNI
jgi:hypothetical protein